MARIVTPNEFVMKAKAENDKTVKRMDVRLELKFEELIRSRLMWYNIQTQK
jgi:hypothetical protein